MPKVDVYTRDDCREYSGRLLYAAQRNGESFEFSHECFKNGLVAYAGGGYAHHPSEDRELQGNGVKVNAEEFVYYLENGELPLNALNTSKSLLGKLSPPLIQFDSTLGAKYDTGKLLFRALTRGLALPLRAVAAVLTYGAIKYKEDSWQHVPDGKARYESALDRHLNAWKAGEECDAESGLPHLAHAACNALFLLWFDITDGTIKGDYTKFNQPPAKVE